MSIKSYVKNLIKKNNNDIELCKKLLRNSAIISKEEGDEEDFQIHMEAFQELEVQTSR